MHSFIRPIAGVALAAAVAACGGGEPAPAPTATPQPTPAGMTVEAAEFAFTPSELSLPAGSGAITLTNKGTIEHDIKIDALGFLVHVKPGETATQTATFAAGTYDFYCSIPGHKQAGMIGTLTVE